MHVSHFSDELRTWLRECGVDRPKLFERSEHRIPLRAHDLRASFVTLALANGKAETWVTTRTGHTTSAMLSRDAESIAELNLGWFAPLHEAIPEFAELDSQAGQIVATAELPEVATRANTPGNTPGVTNPPSSHSNPPHHNSE
jgi:hypothetical protein